MKARRLRQMPLNCKYRWRGMSKSNTRKQNGRRKYAAMDVMQVRCADYAPEKKM
jgi:hypothetical protein